MASDTLFSAESWAMPFHFWSLVFFTFGCAIGSFLNVCIHRMPLGESIVSPPSHCPKCNYAIPWYLNIPLVTWVYLKGKCANCRAAISPRYFLVELLTGLAFMACWWRFGPQHPGAAVVGCVFIAGLIAASFIDLEHYIIPDEMSIGGIVAGFILSFLVPPLHGLQEPALSGKDSFLGIIAGAGIIYCVLRAGKLFFGRHRLQLEPNSRIIFGETCLNVPGQEIAYEDVFYRKSDCIKFEASVLELCDRCYKDVAVELSPDKLQIGDEVLNPEDVPYMEATASELVVPREAMGLGDVKFMAAIGAFLGWQAVIFSLAVSSLIGSVIGVTLIVLKKHERSARLPYGPYIALAAVIWVFVGRMVWDRIFGAR